MTKFAVVPFLALSLFAQDKYIDVQTAVYHPSSGPQVAMTKAAYATTPTRRRRMSKRRKDSVKRIGGGAAGGAVIGALAHGGKGAAIGAIAGGGAGAVYDQHKKGKGQ